MGTEEFFEYLGLKDQEDRDRFSKMAKTPLYGYDPEWDNHRVVYEKFYNTRTYSSREERERIMLELLKYGQIL